MNGTGDDLYINDGADYDQTYYPKTEPELTEKDKEEIGAEAASYPVMGSVSTWFDDWIKEVSDVDSIQATEITINGTTYSRTVSIEAQVLCMQLMKGKIMEKSTEWKKYQPEAES